MRADWITPWWQAAVLPDGWDVYGVKVPCLSVWHTFALENIGNGYLCGGECDMDDAASLLLFASHDMAGGRRLMHGPNYRARQMRAMWRRLHKAEWADVDAACREYTDSCTRTVSRWKKGGAGGHPAVVPYQWHLVAQLSGGDPGRIEAAWNMPYAVAACLYDAAAEAKGDDSLMSPVAQEMEDNWANYKDAPGTMQVRVGMN